MVTLSPRRAVDRNGRRVASFKPSAIMGPTERYLSIPRSDLAAVIYDALCGGVELILNDTVHVLEDDGDTRSKSRTWAQTDCSSGPKANLRTRE